VHAPHEFEFDYFHTYIYTLHLNYIARGAMDHKRNDSIDIFKRLTSREKRVADTKETRFTSNVQKRSK